MCVSEGEVEGVKEGGREGGLCLCITHVKRAEG